MPVPGKKCHAHSSRTGLPCKRWAVPGTTVCSIHGAGAPHVKEAARRRLEELILPAIATLRRLINSADTDATALAAARDLLDRVGMGKTADKLQVDNEIRISVSYQDVGLVPPPGASHALRNGHALTNGQEDI